MQVAESYSGTAFYQDLRTSEDDYMLTAPTSLAPNFETPNTKRHAACDECRTRKLKCSGEPTGCARCRKQQIVCRYSDQKQMGRPRKRQRTDEQEGMQETQPTTSQGPTDSTSSQPYVDHGPISSSASQSPFINSDLPIDPSLAAADRAQASFTNVCNGPIAQTIRDTRDPTTSVQQMAYYNQGQQNNSVQEDAYSDPTLVRSQYPLDISSWPDFSTIDSLPVPMQASEPTSSSYSSSYGFGTTNSSYYDADADPAALQALPAIPSCPCLPNLYLTLSTLSATSAYPVTCHTIQTLLSAHKTAHSVIYCPICPQKYQSGSQNLMLGCTLLNVIADHWQRVKRCPAPDLKKGFGKQEFSPASNTLESFVTVKEGQAWRKFSHDMIQTCVFGKPPASDSPSKDRTTTSILKDTDTAQPPIKPVPEPQTLSFLVTALHRRQRQWHHFDNPTDEFPDCSGAFGECAHAQPHQSRRPHRRRSSSSCRSGQDGGTADADRGTAAHEHEASHAVCLMLVDQCMKMVRILDDDGGES